MPHDYLLWIATASYAAHILKNSPMIGKPGPPKRLACP